MWHASAAPRATYGYGKHRLRAVAEKALMGVGNVHLGQWEEWTGRAYHIRRRLSAAEEVMVGPVVDVRNTSEAMRRWSESAGALPAAAQEFARWEVGVVSVR